MDNNIKDDQIEALETLADYIPKLIGGIDTVKAELRGERKIGRASCRERV